MSYKENVSPGVLLWVRSYSSPYHRTKLNKLIRMFPQKEATGKQGKCSCLRKSQINTQRTTAVMKAPYGEQRLPRLRSQECIQVEFINRFENERLIRRFWKGKASRAAERRGSATGTTIHPEGSCRRLSWSPSSNVSLPGESTLNDPFDYALTR